MYILVYIPCVVLVTVTTSTATVVGRTRYAFYRSGGTLGTATSGHNDHNWEHFDNTTDNNRDAAADWAFPRNKTQHINSQQNLSRN